jgi:hypothetical protein
MNYTGSVGIATGYEIDSRGMKTIVVKGETVLSSGTYSDSCAMGTGDFFLAGRETPGT